MIAHNGDIVPLLEDCLPAGKGMVVMLKAYLDLGRKYDKSDDVMCVASVAFKPTKYKQFIRAWNPMLRAWGASEFHATDFYCGYEQFKRDTEDKKHLFDADCRRIPAMIANRIAYVLMVSFRPLEFDQVASPEWKEQFGTSVHSHAVQLCLIANGWWRYAKCRHESFAYFMETGDTDEGEVLKTVERMRQDNGSNTSQVIRVASFTPVDKGMARGLEAADFVAWHWNKYYMDKIRLGNATELRKDFQVFADIAQHRCEYIFATGEKLKYLFSLVPPEVLQGERLV